jgi:hypothetical protein
LMWVRSEATSGENSESIGSRFGSGVTGSVILVLLGMKGVASLLLRYVAGETTGRTERNASDRRQDNSHFRRWGRLYRISLTVPFRLLEPYYMKRGLVTTGYATLK